VPRPQPAKVDRVAVLGTGTIGASWTAQFLARGLAVAVHDPAAGAEARVREFVAQAPCSWARVRLAFCSLASLRMASCLRRSAKDRSARK
jgi:3-hydroxyacyl-CoA dehydrogenase